MLAPAQTCTRQFSGEARRAKSVGSDCFPADASLCWCCLPSEPKGAFGSAT